MSMFRKRRLTDEQLQSIFRSLPQAKAPADTEERLGQLIARHSDHVPSVLGTLPWISAPADFDDRLMEAIRDSRRPVTPILPSPIAGGASSGWFTNIPGWVGGVIAAAGLLFFLNHSGDMTEPEIGTHAAPAPASVSTSPATIAPAAPREASAPSRMAQAGGESQSRTVTPPAVGEMAPVTGGEPIRNDVPASASARRGHAATGTATELRTTVVHSVGTASSTPAETRVAEPRTSAGDGGSVGMVAPAKQVESQLPTVQSEAPTHSYPARVDSVAEHGAESGPNNVIVDTGRGRQDSAKKNP